MLPPNPLSSASSFLHMLAPEREQFSGRRRFPLYSDIPMNIPILTLATNTHLQLISHWTFTLVVNTHLQLLSFSWLEINLVSNTNTPVVQPLSFSWLVVNTHSQLLCSAQGGWGSREARGDAEPVRGGRPRPPVMDCGSQ